MSRAQLARSENQWTHNIPLAIRDDGRPGIAISSNAENVVKTQKRCDVVSPVARTAHRFIV